MGNKPFYSFCVILILYQDTICSSNQMEYNARLPNCSISAELELVKLLNNKVYYFSSKNSKGFNWYYALEFCANDGMQLAVVEDWEELQLLGAEFPPYTPFWVSASDIGHSPGHFHWGNGAQVDDALWHKLEPVEPNEFGDDLDTCANVRSNETEARVFLADDRCTDEHFFICERLPMCL